MGEQCLVGPPLGWSCRHVDCDETLVRTAYAAYERGDVMAMLDTVD